MLYYMIHNPGSENVVSGFNVTVTMFKGDDALFLYFFKFNSFLPVSPRRQFLSDPRCHLFGFSAGYPLRHHHLHIKPKLNNCKQTDRDLIRDRI